MEGAADVDRITLVSGGQTGIDRAVLDFCLERGIPCGGWCPEGRVAEDGTIPSRYPLNELPGGSYDQRTLRNVQESDATVIIYPGRMKGGTLKSLEYAHNENKPLLLLDMSLLGTEEAAKLLVQFLSQERSIQVNFSGPRKSEWAEGYDLCRSLLTLALESRNFVT